jgi:hypothetical protein
MNGCHNRPPLHTYLLVQDGWHLDPSAPTLSRNPVMRLVPAPMSKDCRHTVSEPSDPGCTGCRWQAEK